jgi:hypothetical protein
MEDVMSEDIEMGDVEWCMTASEESNARRNLNAVCSPALLRQWLEDKGEDVDPQTPKTELIARVIQKYLDE